MPSQLVYRDEDEGSIILSLISQLRCVHFDLRVIPSNPSACPYRVGMDLSKVTFPTFVLEPRSMLERITDFMAHPDLIFG
jgi:oxysterol-binding protein-related protein 8